MSGGHGGLSSQNSSLSDEILHKLRQDKDNDHGLNSGPLPSFTSSAAAVVAELAIQSLAAAAAAAAAAGGGGGSSPPDHHADLNSPAGGGGRQPVNYHNSPGPMPMTPEPQAMALNLAASRNQSTYGESNYPPASPSPWQQQQQQHFEDNYPSLARLQDLVNNNKLLQPFIRSDRPVVIHLMGISSNSNNNRVTTLDNFYNLLLHQDRCLTVTNFHQRLLIHRLNNNNKILHDAELQAVLNLLSLVSPQQRLRLQQLQLLLPLFLLHLPRLLLDRLANVVLQHRRVQDQQLLEEQVAALQRLHHLPRPPVAEPIRIQVRHQVQAMLPSLPASFPAVMQAFKIGAMSTCRVFLATRKPIRFLRRLLTHVTILTAATPEIPG